MSLRRFSTAALFSVSILALAIGLYFIFDQFLGVTGDEIVKAWYFGEMVDLQEGQILPSIAKNQSVLENSPFIKAVILVDVKDPDRPLFSIGEMSKAVSPKDLEASRQATEKLIRHRSGFLANIIMARIPGNNNLIIVYEITSRLLIWSYLLTVLLGILFVVYLMGITIRIANLERRKREAVRTDLLDRLSHDLGSPLLTISNLSLKIKKLDKDLYQRLEQASESIRGLLSQTNKTDKKLLSGTTVSASAIDDELNAVPLFLVLTEFMIAKRSELSGMLDLNLDFEADENCRESFVKINLNDFRRHLSNIFNNSIQAMDNQPDRKILLQVSLLNSEIEISIIDTGCGIPREQLHLVGKKGKSLGGKDGKGLGLHFAIESIRHWQGDFELESEQGVGTKISIRLPIVATPDWYISKLTLAPKQKIIFVDDDISMILRWKSTLAIQQHNFVEFNTAEQFRSWFHAGGQLEDNLKFVFDYHLDGDNTGLALIDELGIATESTLVTSGYLDEDIISEAKRLDVQVMPKVLA